MSDAGSPIKTPKQLAYAIIAAFLIPIAVIVLLTQYVGNLKNPSNASDAYTEEKILERIAPIGSIRTEPVLADLSANEKDANITKVALSGEEVYANRCAACHEAGVLNAPKIGDTAAWAPRISLGLDTLLYSVLNGKGAMASQKGPLNTDEELKSAVIYLTNKSGGSL
ncbi:c-type cytochrome [Betaproteobacteria bacterium]|nr:c-type cytochrome [Betaproteobacteria bacterium]